MKSILIKSILINNNEISIETIKKSFDKREIKTIFFTEYKCGILSMREKIYIKCNDAALEKNESVIFKISNNTTIGCGCFLGKDSNGYGIFNKLKLEVKNDEFIDNPLQLFRMFNVEELRKRNLKYSSSIPKEEVVKDIYQRGLFKIYYYMLNESFTNLSENIEGKYSAMCSYLAFEKVLNEKGIYVSYPNCYVKGYKCEYDALITKSRKKKYFYNSDEILATVELKVSGCFYKKIEMEDSFKKYLINQKIVDKKIPHIYLTCHESSTNTSRDGRDIRYYDTCKKVVDSLGTEYIGIFCTIKNNSDQFIIPIEYDLDKLLKRIGCKK